MNHDSEKNSGEIVLSVRDLKTYFYLDNTVLKAIDGISFDLRKGQTLCLPRFSCYFSCSQPA